MNTFFKKSLALLSSIFSAVKSAIFGKLFNDHSNETTTSSAHLSQASSTTKAKVGGTSQKYSTKKKSAAISSASSSSAAVTKTVTAPPPSSSSSKPQKHQQQTTPKPTPNTHHSAPSSQAQSHQAQPTATPSTVSTPSNIPNTKDTQAQINSEANNDTSSKMINPIASTIATTETPDSIYQVQNSLVLEYESTGQLDQALKLLNELLLSLQKDQNPNNKIQNQQRIDRCKKKKTRILARMPQTQTNSTSNTSSTTLSANTTPTPITAVAKPPAKAALAALDTINEDIELPVAIIQEATNTNYQLHENLVSCYEKAGQFDKAYELLESMLIILNADQNPANQDRNRERKSNYEHSQLELLIEMHRYEEFFIKYYSQTLPDMSLLGQCYTSLGYFDSGMHNAPNNTNQMKEKNHQYFQEQIKQQPFCKKNYLDYLDYLISTKDEQSIINFFKLLFEKFFSNYFLSAFYLRLLKASNRLSNNTFAAVFALRLQQLRSNALFFVDNIKVSDQDAMDVLKKITASGHHGLIVGGFNLAQILKLRPDDVDIITDTPTSKLKEIFGSSLYEQKGLELTSLNLPPLPDGSKPKVTLFGLKVQTQSGSTLSFDILSIEDFPLFAQQLFPVGTQYFKCYDKIFSDNTGTVFFPFPHASQKVLQKELLPIPPIQVRGSLDSDPTRIYRADRFLLKYGFPISDQEQAIIKESAKSLAQISLGKFLPHFRKLFLKGFALKALDLLQKQQILPVIFPALAKQLEDPQFASWFRNQLAKTDQAQNPSEAFLFAALFPTPPHQLQEYLAVDPARIYVICNCFLQNNIPILEYKKNIIRQLASNLTQAPLSKFLIHFRRLFLNGNALKALPLLAELQILPVVFPGLQEMLHQDFSARYIFKVLQQIDHGEINNSEEILLAVVFPISLEYLREYLTTKPESIYLICHHFLQFNELILNEKKIIIKELAKNLATIPFSTFLPHFCNIFFKGYNIKAINLLQELNILSTIFPGLSKKLPDNAFKSAFFDIMIYHSNSDPATMLALMLSFDINKLNIGNKVPLNLEQIMSVVTQRLQMDTNNPEQSDLLKTIATNIIIFKSSTQYAHLYQDSTASATSSNPNAFKFQSQTQPPSQSTSSNPIDSL